MLADFRDLLAGFVAGGVRFLVVGAHALAAHGVPRVTADLDLWIEATPDNAARVWTALVEFGAPLASLRVHEDDFSRPGQVVQFGLPPYRIDILTSVSGVDFTEAWPNRSEATLFDIPVAFLGRDDLIRNKRASGRPKDLSDIEALGGGA